MVKKEVVLVQKKVEVVELKVVLMIEVLEVSLGPSCLVSMPKVRGSAPPWPGCPHHPVVDLQVVHHGHQVVHQSGERHLSKHGCLRELVSNPRSRLCSSELLCRHQSC